MLSEHTISNPMLRSGLISLGEGETYYRFDGPESGQLVLMVHGATVAHWEFDMLVPHLVKAGYQTLRYDLYGHGQSARPKGPYNPKRFITQCEELLDAFSVPNGIVWFAHSMGAAISAAVLSRRPQLAQHIVLSAPMLNFSKTNPVRWFMRAPGLSPLFVRSVVMPYLHRRRHRKYHAIGHPQLATCFAEQFRRPNTWRAILGLERDGSLGDQSEAYRALGAFADKVTLLCGDADSVIPHDDIQQVFNLLPGARLHRLTGLKHNMALASAPLIASLVLNQSSLNEF